MLTTAAFWLASTWDPFYLESAGVPRQSGLGRLRDGADALLLLTPALLATGVSLTAFLNIATHRSGANRSEGGLGIMRAVGLSLALVGLLTLSMLGLPLRGQLTIAPLPTEDNTSVGVLLTGLIPAGELVDGKVIRQPVDEERLPVPNGLRRGDRLCLQILVATYLDRDNTGSLEVTLSAPGSDGGTAWRFRLDANDLRDNTWASGCFDERPSVILDSLRGVGGVQSEITVRGIGAAPGTAATVWLRPAQGAGATNQTGAAGSDADEVDALVHRFAVGRPPLHRRALAFYGTLLATAGGSLLLAPLIRGRRLRVGSQSAGRPWEGA